MYLLLKTVHVIAVVVFLGNVITGLFWKAHADRTRDLRIMAHTMDGIIRADRLFTVPGVLVIVAAGFWAAIEGRYPILGTGWILWSIILFSASGISFMWRVAPLQHELLMMTKGAELDGFDWTGYRSKSMAWDLWGGFATITPLAALVLMILKLPA